MLQPDKLKKLNENASRMSEAGSSKEEILAMKDAFIKQFGQEVSEKKKAPATSTSKSTKLASEVPTGSSVGVVENKGRLRLPNDSEIPEESKETIRASSLQNKRRDKLAEPLYDMDSKGRELVSSKKTNKARIDDRIEYEKIVHKKDVKATPEQLSNFSNTAKLTEEEKALKAKEVDDEINTKGFWNNAKYYGTKALNAVSGQIAKMTDEPGLDKELEISTDALSNYKEAYKSQQKEQGVNVSKLTDTEVFNGARDLKIKETQDKLKEDKITLYIDTLSDEEKNNLNLDRLFKKSVLDQKDRVYLASTEVSKQNLEDSNAKMKVVLTKFNNKESLSAEEIDFAKGYEQNSKILAEDYNDNYLKYQKNNINLNDVDHEYDLLKRDYSIVNKIFGNVAGNTARIALGLAAIENHLSFDDEEKKANYASRIAEDQKKVDDYLENTFQKNTTGWKGKADAFEYVADVLSNQAANIALMVGTGGVGGLGSIVPLLGIGAYSTGNKINELTQSNNEGKTFYTDKQISQYAFVSGAGEMLEMGTMGNLMRFKKFMGASLSQPATRALFLESTRKTLAKSLGTITKSVATENAEELGTLWIDILAKEKFLGVKTSKKEIADLTERTLKDTSTMSVLMAGTPQLAHQIIKPLLKKSYVVDLDKNTKEIVRLNNELKKTNLTQEETVILKKSLDKKINENKTILDGVIDVAGNLSEEQRKKAIDLELTTSEIRAEARSVRKSKTISSEVKSKLLKDLESEHNKQEELREKIVSGKTTVLDVVSEDKKQEMKSNALKALLNEKEGSNEAQFTNDVIEQKAVEIHNKEVESKKLKDAETQSTVANQTKPETEVQEPIVSEQAEIVSQSITDLEKQRDAEIEALKAKRQYDARNIKPIKERYDALILVEKSKETRSKIKNKGLFLEERDSNGNRVKDENGIESQSVGEMISQSTTSPIPTSVSTINNLEVVEFSNPNTGDVDVIVTGTNDGSYVGYYRIYENGKPTNKWSSKMNNNSGSKQTFKDMMSGVQQLIPENHEYTEKTSISTDGLRVWEQQLSRGYEMQTDSNGNVVTNEVAINGDAIVNELGIDVNQGNFNNISVTNNQQFESVKKALIPYLKKLGLNESNVRWDQNNKTVKIDLPVLKKSTTNEATPKSNITSDGNIPVGDNADLQQGKVEDMQSSAIVGESKATVKRIKSVKEGEFDISFDENGNVSKVNSVKDGREIPKFVERINPKTKKVTLVKNANYSRIEADALGYDTNNKTKVDKQKQIAEAIDTFQVTNEYDAALHALGTGAKVSLESIKSETGNKDATWATNQSSKTELPSIEKLSETIWGANPELDQTEIRNALIDIIGSHSSLYSVKNSIFDSSITNVKKLQQQENYAFLGSLSEKDFAMYEALQVEDEYLSELSDKEGEDYYNEKYNEYEQGRAATEAGTETVNQKPINSSESNEGTPREKATEEVKENIFNQNNIKDDLDWLDSFKLDPNNINSTLPFLPQVWNALIDAIKVARMAGNTMSKAIEIAREELSKKFDSKDIDNAINAFAEKANITLDNKQEDNSELEKKPIDNNKIEKGSFEDLAAKMPSSGVFGTYLSGETTEKLTDSGVSNNQEYEKLKITEAFIHGKNIIQKAIEQFGSDYVAKVLDFVDSYQLGPENIALVYISLENYLRNIVETTPGSLTAKKQLDLVRAKRQAYSKSVGQAMNMNKLQNIDYYGYNSSQVTDLIFTSKEIEIKRKIEKAIQADADAINKEAELFENEEDDFVIAQPKTKRNSKVIKKELSDVWAKMKADISKANRGTMNMALLPYQQQIITATPHIIKASKLLAELGVFNTTEIINEIYDNLKESFPSLSKKDIKNIIREDIDSDKKATSKKPSVKNSTKELVKQSLIEAGFGREINVTKKDENGNKVKEKRQVLDWKKLAGEEGSIDKIKENVEKVLKDKGYNNFQISEMKNDLENEYHDLRASIIEKSVNELDNRNTPRDRASRRELSKKLAEIYNLGLFESDSKTYDHLLNSALGLNDLDMKTFNELKEKSKAMSDLYSSKFSEESIKTKIDEVQKQINDILYKSIFRKGGGTLKTILVFKEYMDISQRLMLHSLGQIIQNPFSGIAQRVITKLQYSLDGKDTKALRKSRSKLGRNVFNDITGNAALSYGSVESSMSGHSRTEDRLNKISDVRLYHKTVTLALGRMHLEAPDSFNKAIITQKYFQNNLIKILTDKKNPNGAMSKKDAVNFVSEKITGQSFEDALIKAKQLVEDINSKNGKKTLSDKKESIYRLADGIVREALLQGNKLSQHEIEASYKAAYKSAGFDLGHEANNFISKELGLYGSDIDNKIKLAIKEQNWGQVSMLTIQSILFRNILNKFVGGGTNWIVLTAQKGGVDIVSPIFDAVNARSNKMDLTPDVGLRNLEKALMRSTNSRSTKSRVLIGGLSGIAIAVAMVQSGGSDDLEDWLKKNEWSRKYFNYISPMALSAYMAYHTSDKDFIKNLKSILGVREAYFEDLPQLIASVELLLAAEAKPETEEESETEFDQEKHDKGMGGIGKVIGSKFTAPIPWRTMRDVQNIYRSLYGLEPIKTDYKPKDYWDGYFKGSFTEFIMMQKDRDKPKDEE